MLCVLFQCILLFGVCVFVTNIIIVIVVCACLVVLSCRFVCCVVMFIFVWLVLVGVMRVLRQSILYSLVCVCFCYYYHCCYVRVCGLLFCCVV